MNLFFEESGDFKAGVMMSQAGEAYQVEMQSGKRTKVKVRDVLLQFAAPAPQELIAAAKSVCDEIDLDFLWEVAGEEEFGFADLAVEYFGKAPQPEQSAGLLFLLHSSPIYFYKKGKGRYKAAPETALKAAQAGIEKKKQQAIVQAQYVEQLKVHALPESMRPLVRQLLFKPDKNSLEFKALDAACSELQTTAPRLMLACGGLDSAKQLHFERFLYDQFPKGLAFPAFTIPAAPKLPVADVQAFSIDDVTTTEIDDAFSVTTLADGMVRIGIHIAAPALGIQRDDAIDAMARARMSTVYMPGDKITMLPDDLVQSFTLAEGKTCPAVSLYATLDPADWSVIKTETRAEAVPIAANLRHNTLDEFVTEENLAAGTGEYPHKVEIALIWQWALVLEQGRMAKREGFGLRPEQNNRVDFNFYVDDDVVTIAKRKRGAPLDKLVAELMIFANSTWGKLMNDCGVPGIYRAQGGGSGGWATKMAVRMVTHAAPHQGLGVDQYAWSTSPLRRYTDLVNQWQILACVEHGVTAPLAAPFKPRDADLFAIVSAFDATYSAYNEFQSNMERYWCLRWLGQQASHRLEAVVLKDEILRLADLPLVIKLPGMQALPRGTQVLLDLARWDEVDLSVEARLIEVVPAAVEELGEDEEETQEADAVAEVDADTEVNHIVAPDLDTIVDGAPLADGIGHGDGQPIP
ncbi:RNB domain-containing ribonuclease [Actimicrobium sp. CCC2.4]|uniref:ribonuclease catalytic domain-containing protein n=1 Tax=Actimicrobium sp. CCC2.4 TaxID=3048606 RepID=UPI002AC8D49F|nr:RNB domain-containing ribonuclease [Actimicrobium sp. CCC2.4]MEB0136720.1 RNB domain-containing ribonuclease [Actimicrobium sp. CCC2.4]WPX33184.1 RNB domain-containing ribonuclease [Actimicrobium sp. CCC2.4]